MENEILLSNEKAELGKNFIQNSKFSDAEKILKQALDLNPKNAEAHFWQGVLLFNQKNFENAVETLTTCIELAPNKGQAYGLRAWVHYKLFELEDAISDFSKAIEINSDPNDLTIFYNNRGLAYEKNGDYELAAQDYSKCIELDPYDVSGYYNRGNVYLKLAEYEKAIADYDKALEFADNDLTWAINSNRENAEKLLNSGERKVWSRNPVNIRFSQD